MTQEIENVLRFTFKNDAGVEVKCEIRPETIATQRLADDEYSQVYVGCIRRGIPPRSVLEKMLYDQEMWSKEDDETMSKLQLQVATLEKALEESNVKSESAQIAKSLGALRTKLLEIVRSRGDILNNSAEYVAEQARRDAVVAFNCYYTDSNKRVFESYDDFLERSDEDVTLAARRAVTIDLLQGFSAFVDSLPEAAYAEVQDGELVEVLEGLREARDAIDEANEPTEDSDTATATRKKTAVRKKVAKKKAAKKTSTKKQE